MEDQSILLIEVGLSVVGLIGAAIAWVYKLLSKKFDKMDARFEWMDNKIETKIHGLRSEMHDLRSDMQEQNSQLRTEVQQQNSELRNEMNQFRTEVHQGFCNLQNYIFLGKIDNKLNENSEENPKQ